MKHNTVKIVVMCADAIPSAILGVFEPLKRVEEYASFEIQFIKTIDIRKRHLDSCDILVCVRSSENLEVRIADACRKAGKFLIYYIDDDLLNIPTVVKCAQYFNDNNISQNITSIIGMCDVLLSVNPLLLEKYGKYCSRRVLVKGPATLLDYRCKSEKSAGNKVKIGFAGSIDHARTLDLILSKVLVRIEEEYRDMVSFEFLGSKPGVFEILKNAKYIPYMSDIEQYRDFMCNCSWDIGLAPLPEGDFFRHKYYNKFLEYGAAGICGVYSKTEPFTFIVEDGQNGVLADNAQEDWYNKLKMLIEDRELRDRLANNAFKILEQSYTLEKVGTEMVEKVKELTSYRRSEERVRIYGLTPFQNRLIIWKDKALRIIKKHGLMGIVIILGIILTKLSDRINSIRQEQTINK